VIRSQILTLCVAIRKACLNIGFDRDLNGACAIASYFLHYKLHSLKVKSKFIQGEYEGLAHCWVEIGNAIVDITAVQFSVDTDFLLVDALDARYNSTVKRYIKDNLKSWPEKQKPENYCGTWVNDKLKLVRR